MLNKKRNEKNVKQCYTEIMHFFVKTTELLEGQPRIKKLSQICIDNIKYYIGLSVSYFTYFSLH